MWVWIKHLNSIIKRVSSIFGHVVHHKNVISRNAGKFQLMCSNNHYMSDSCFILFYKVCHAFQKLGFYKNISYKNRCFILEFWRAITRLIFPFHKFFEEFCYLHWMLYGGWMHIFSFVPFIFHSRFKCFQTKTTHFRGGRQGVWAYFKLSVASVTTPEQGEYSKIICIQIATELLAGCYR